MNNTSSDESVDEEDVIRNFDAEARLIINTDTLPKKSVDRYNLVYDTYKKWQIEHKTLLSNSAENNLIVYFKELSKKLKPSTIWSVWSILKSTLNTRDNVNINNFLNLKALVKNNSKGYKPKKSSVLKWDEILKFINNAPDYVHLASKVILIFGICGALRCDELTKLKIQDVENNGNKYLVSIHESKNDMPRQFIIGDLFYKKVTQYMSLRPKDQFTDRFFIQYHKGKCQRQVIGKNKIGETPQIIAAYLNLENPKQYTGHCFRRTGATLLSNSGASTTMLKQLGGWKSLTIAQGYVENSLKNREKIYERITNATVSNDHLNPQPSTSKNYSSGTITANKNLKSTEQNDNSDDFSDDFIISEDDLVAIDKLNQLTTTKPPITSVTTQTKRKVLTESNKPLPSTHFMSLPPIPSLFVKKQENEPPLKMKNIMKLILILVNYHQNAYLQI
ncbi:uncharacterized protein LOC120358251 [Solenopsis invicta]|uniref:uncharacterized protein LOC120358251 n=1 Tax=Solenopsis invicta TaxID=13686 RepID=UPI00193DBC1A|nr:uncharacterized protein LOC120358251 [Solenopsis invicta]